MCHASERFLPPERVWGKMEVCGHLSVFFLSVAQQHPCPAPRQHPAQPHTQSGGQDRYDGGLNGRPGLSLWTAPVCLRGRTGRLRKAGWISRLLVLLTPPFADPREGAA